MRPLGGLLSAMVTRFRGDGRVNEDGAVALGRHLLANGSDGFVVCGTTGESPTLTDDEMVSLVTTMVEEFGDEAIVAAGAGSNATHHACHLAERMAAAGAHALLSVTGYYNRPNRRGIVRHYEEVASAAGGTPVIVYNIPSRTTVNLDPELPAELAAFCFSSHIVGTEMRRMFDEPEHRAEIDASLRHLFKAMFCTASPIPIKTALNLLGHDVGGLRLPLVEADESELGVIRSALERQGLLTGAHAA